MKYSLYSCLLGGSPSPASFLGRAGSSIFTWAMTQETVQFSVPVWPASFARPPTLESNSQPFRCVDARQLSLETNEGSCLRLLFRSTLATIQSRLGGGVKSIGCYH